MSFPTTSFPLSVTLGAGAGFALNNVSAAGGPVDVRTVYPTVSAALAGIPTVTGLIDTSTLPPIFNQRYPGLTVFIIDEQKEYWFKEGLTDEHFVEKVLQTTYESIESALEGTENQRFLGLTVFITDDQKEYWFKEGLEDTDLVVKTVEASGGDFDLSGLGPLAAKLTSEGYIVAA
jgi:hypothetical protein